MVQSAEVELIIFVVVDKAETLIEFSDCSNVFSAFIGSSLSI